jgi:hypothetical protein
MIGTEIVAVIGSIPFASGYIPDLTRVHVQLEFSTKAGHVSMVSETYMKKVVIAGLSVPLSRLGFVITSIGNSSFDVGYRLPDRQEVPRGKVEQILDIVVSVLDDLGFKAYKAEMPAE